MMDEIAVFDELLTQDNVDYLYQNGTPTTDQQYPFVAGSVGTAPTYTDTVSYWKLEDNAASTAVVDSVGTNDGVATGNTSTLTTTGKLNNGFDFDGVNDAIDMGADSSVQITSDLSLSFWINMGTIGTSIPIIYANNNSGQARAYEVYLGLNSDSTTASISFRHGTTLARVTTDTNPLTLSTWHHVLITRSGTDLQNMTFYVDGVVVANSLLCLLVESLVLVVGIYSVFYISMVRWMKFQCIMLF
jgi:hypothetical protein